jgi:hypothetical protein
LLVCAIGCQGPISDWPHSKGGDEDGIGAPSPIGSLGGNGSAVTPGSGAGAGGVVGGTMGPPPMSSTPGGTSAGTSADAGLSTPGLIGGATTGGSGALIGGTGGGAPNGMGDAGAPADAAVALDGGTSDAALDGGVDGAADGAVDAGAPDAAHDGGCAQASAPDASMCPGYGCRTTLQQLRTSMKQGACSSEQAAALVCDGRVGNVALQCTQDNVFALNISRAVSGCLKRDPQIGMLSNACVDCFVEEALCTLARCFAACTVDEGSDCKTCRQQQCSAMFASCSGLPAPSFGP